MRPWATVLTMTTASDFSTEENSRKNPSFWHLLKKEVIYLPMWVPLQGKGYMANILPLAVGVVK